MSITDANVNETLLKYESFINNVLKEDLKRIDSELQRVNAEIADLIQQQHTMKLVSDKERHPDGFKTQIDLGCNFYMDAVVRDTSKMLFHIGLFHYLEFTADEANRYMDARIKAFEVKANELRDKSAATKAHIKLMLFHIGELQGIDKR